MLKLSVIVPVYNAGKHIEVCVKSLLNQTMDDLELIFVDDHGTDGSFEQLKKLLASYTGKKVLKFAQTPANSGPGAARNVGIELASGEYLAFVDSDDRISPLFCEKLYDTAKDSDADMACCDIEIDGKQVRNAEASSIRHFLMHFVSFFYTFIYKKNLIERYRIRFPLSRNSEDTVFLTSCILVAERIGQIHEPLYFYTNNPSSLSKTRNRAKAWQRIKSFRKLLIFCNRYKLGRVYFFELSWIWIKKCWGMVAKDLILG